MPARNVSFSALLLFASIASFSTFAQEISDSSRQVFADSLSAPREPTSSVPQAADSLGAWAAKTSDLLSANLFELTGQCRP